MADDPERSGRLAAALAGLAQERAVQRRPLPDVAVARVTARGVTLHLAAPAPPPTGAWVVGSDRLTWTLRFDDLLGDHGGGSPRAPLAYPALVEVGHDVGGHVLVDLAYAGGLVALSGEGAPATLAGIVADLATQPWSAGARVSLVGPAAFGASAAFPGTAVVGLPDVLAEVEGPVLAAAALREELHAAGVFHGRSGSGPRAGVHVIALLAPPDAAEAARLARVLRARRDGLAAICDGDAPSARWRLSVDGSGVVDAGVLDGPRRSGPDGARPAGIRARRHPRPGAAPPAAGRGGGPP